MKAHDNGLSASEIIALERGGTCKENLQVQDGGVDSGVEVVRVKHNGVLNYSLKVHKTITLLHDRYRDVAVALDICYPEPHEIVVHDINGNVEYTLSKQEVNMLREQMKTMLVGGGE